MNPSRLHGTNRETRWRCRTCGRLTAGRRAHAANAPRFPRKHRLADGRVCLGSHRPAEAVIVDRYGRPVDEIREDCASEALVTTHAGALEVSSHDAWHGIVHQFLAAHVDSPHSRRAYRRHLLALADLSIRHGAPTPAHLSAAHLSAFREHVIRRGGALASQRQALAAVRSFVRWARAVAAPHLPDADQRGALLSLPKGGSDVHETPAPVGHDVEALMAAAANAAPRDRAILALLLGAGLRRSELALERRALERDGDGWRLRIAGKGGKVRRVPLLPSVRRALEDYIAAEGLDLDTRGPLFPGQNPKLPLSGRTVYNIARRAAAAAGLERPLGAHSMRHGFARRQLDAGLDLERLRRTLGHSSIATTQKYLQSLRDADAIEGMTDLPG